MKLAYTTPNARSVSVWPASDTGKISNTAYVDGWTTWHETAKLVGEEIAEQLADQLVAHVPSVYSKRVEFRFVDEKTAAAFAAKLELLGCSRLKK